MINKTTPEMRDKIRRKTVIVMPDRPSERGFHAAAIKDALSKPICGEDNSVLAELDRVVDEANAILSPLSETVRELDEEYDNVYALDTTTTPSIIAFMVGKDKTYSLAAGSSLSLSVPAMVQGNRAGLNWKMPVPATITVTNNTGFTLIVRSDQGGYKSIANGSSDTVTISYASNVSAVKLQSIAYCDGAECVVLITRVHNTTI